MDTSFLQELLNSVAEQGRSLLPRSLRGVQDNAKIEELAAALMSVQGQASGVAIAREIQIRYRELDVEGRASFFRFLADGFNLDREQIMRAATRYIANPSDETLLALQRKTESRRQKFFRRLNLAPGATGDIVAMRRDMHALEGGETDFAAIDRDMFHLLASWFNRGFLVLKRIDWHTPASILEKIIEYEAVHEIEGWDDLRRRLEPADRRCFAFFHPSLVDDPLIFVEVALSPDVPGSIQNVLSEAPKTNGTAGAPTTAVFYSISNCQDGLRGISFGNFLIKQVVEELARELPSLKTFVTLSPIPSFNRWLLRELNDEDSAVITQEDRVALQVLKDPGWIDEIDDEAAIKSSLMALAAHYFLVAKRKNGQLYDPVARFHLGNGASLDRINWLGDISTKGLTESSGLMVNYRYDPSQIEANHEAFANDGQIAASRAVRSLVRPPAKTKPQRERPRLLALPIRSAGTRAPAAKVGAEETGG